MVNALDPDRPLRSDARRNREKILSTAVRVFAEQGLDANLDQIAKEAGVGAGTLYRNFPTREALVEAAYRNELARLCDAAPVLLATMTPREAIRAWMGLYIDYATAKHGMADALRAVVDTGRNPCAHSRELMLESLSSLLAAGVADGTVRPDVGADDLLACVVGIALASRALEQRPQAERLLDLAMDGLRRKER
ncbi:helix-turn-helix domain-containing protein [Sphaerisporangium sp. B11E5]|uniref:TetR/AcrR family transcriptional regulator n=1 Tax=Sphaerisporangium sp. B11E5 TaxID=3153563 RepID=UPI00325ED771